MRVLLVSDFFPPVRGGLESHVDALALELCERGHAVEVATLTPSPEPTSQQITVHTVQALGSRILPHRDPTRPFAMPLPDPIALWQLRRIVATFRPDVIHGHSWLSASVPRAAAPFVFTAHDYALVCQLRTLQRTSGENCAGPSAVGCLKCARRSNGVFTAAGLGATTSIGRRILNADAIIAVSATVRDRIAGSVRAPITVVPNFLTNLPPTAASLPAALRRPFVMYAGDPGRHKGVDVLLKCWESDPVDADLLLALTKPLQRQVPPAVYVVHLSRAEVLDAWNQAAVAVVPSVWREPFGTVAIEALAAGTPTIVAKTGALPEIVRDGVDGYHVPPGDSDALRAALRSLLGNAASRAAMAVAATEGSSRFRAQAVVPEIERIYRAVSGQ